MLKKFSKRFKKSGLPLFLAFAISISFAAGFAPFVSEKLDELYEKKHIAAYWAEISKFDGKIENRLIVESTRKIDTLNSVKAAPEYRNTYYLQFINSKDAEDALNYYKGLRCVKSVYRDTAFSVAENEEENLDSKCFASSNSNIDDALKLISSNYSDLPEIKVAVIDTGCERYDYFGNRVVATEEEYTSEDTHGTLVSGTIFHNTLDNVKILNYDCGSDDGISQYTAMTAVATAYNDGCKIVNMSFGGYEDTLNNRSTCLKYAAKGMILVGAAGNENTNTSETPHYPSDYISVISVGALTAERRRASFSNYGAVDYWTTGVSVRAYYRGAYRFWNGTSASAPVLCSIIANLLTVNPNLSLSTVKSYLSANKNCCAEPRNAYHVVNNYSAVEALSGKTFEKANIDYEIYTENSKKYLRLFSSNAQRIYYSTEFSARYPNSYRDAEYSSPIEIDDYCVITACAYGNSVERSTPLVINFAPSGEELVYATTTDNEWVIAYNDVKEQILHIPETVSLYGYSEDVKIDALYAASFAGNEYIEEIYLPASCTSIGEYAFMNCPNLKKVVAPGATEIGVNAFLNCPKLKEVICPNVAQFYTGSFRNCPELVIAQSDSKDIKAYSLYRTFDGCPKLINSVNNMELLSLGENGAVYRNSVTEETKTLSFDDLEFLWNEYYINKNPGSDYYDSTVVFDLNKDGIVNAKDFAIIIKQ